MYSDVVLGFEHHHFEDILDTFKDGQGYTLDTDLTGDDWVDLVGRYKEAVARETGHVSRRIRMRSYGARSVRCFHPG
jgi:pyruvate,orthophosphate dikinase